jgi:hypothetical protein
MSETRATDSIVVLHIDEEGNFDLKVWGDERVRVIWIDERSPGDRVYEQTHREADPNELKALIGDDRIGHAKDGYLDDQTVQAIRAMAWRLDGGKLTALTETPS